MSTDELDPIKRELSKIRGRYDAIINDLEELRKLSPEKYKQTSLKEGLVLKAAKNAESILRYVCNASNINVTVGQNKVGSPVFSDYIYHAHKNKLINDKLKSEFDQIRSIRNSSAHHDGDDAFNLNHEELSIHKAEVIEDALTYITDWFFHTFLKGKYPDLSLKKSITKDQPPIYKKYEPTPIKEEPKVAQAQKTINKPTQKTNKIRKKNIRFVLIGIGVIGLIISILYSLNGRFVEESPSLVNQNSPLINEANANASPDLNATIDDSEEDKNRKRAQKILKDYYKSIASHTFVANFFADEIDEFKFLNSDRIFYDQTPEELNKMSFYLTTDYNAEIVIDYNKFNLKNRNSIFPVWQYECKSNDFIINDDSQKRVLIEFSLNADNKITSLTEKYIPEENEGS
jgi:hypothetical protein